MNSNSSFEEVYDAYKKLVYNLALNYVQNYRDAEDITQEVFIKIYQQLSTHDSSLSSLKTWVCKVTIHQCIDAARAKRTKKRLGFVVSLFKKDSNEPEFDEVVSTHPGIAAEDKEQLNSLLKLINELPDNQKTVLLLLKSEDLTQREVAAIMEISVKAVESLLQRAKNTLQKKLDAREGF
ncbi:RNA polymerase sigma factor [Ferruginibacter sp. HRS2-29]|uniref:RNA polymerase sigma factor n=1 Tax=Ferruginibacter sp. HRS2-29 TaxID=2487334 RepID=UPI0020CC410D|nr:RNA polymerase sigma factor [Ferruginibacter sp. HRS2-29]MCP9752947.1 RNA polymerase sigma factor [Ferruginibacter sp. HRS2-29]